MKFFFTIIFIILSYSWVFADTNLPEHVVIGIRVTDYTAAVSNKMTQVIMAHYGLPDTQKSITTFPPPRMARVKASPTTKVLVWVVWKDHLLSENCSNCGKRILWFYSRCSGCGTLKTIQWDAARLQSVRDAVSSVGFVIEICEFGGVTALLNTKGLEWEP